MKQREAERESERARIRMYPDKGLKKVEGEFRSTLVEMVRENFSK